MSVTVKLRALRENHPDKPSQRVLGDLLGIAEGNYRRLENGHAKSISFDAIDKLCGFFNCTPNDILEYKND
jgi:DNA-binding Xre family transcriptional regulator